MDTFIYEFILHLLVSAVQEEIENFRKWMTGERKSRHTVKEYSFLVSKFLLYAGKDISLVSAEDIAGYKHYMAVNRKYAKSTQYLAIKAIRLYYRFRSVELPDNLNSPVRSGKLPVYLTDKEASSLISAAAPNPRDLAVIMVLIYTGMRVSELCSLDINDLALDDRTIRIRSGKGDKDRLVILSGICAEKVEDYLRERVSVKTASEAVFLSNRKGRMDPSTVERMVRRVSIKAGINKRVTPHVLRHTFATSVLRNGGDIRFIQQILGHASVATTQIYTHIDDRMLKKMYEEHGPFY